MTEGCLYCDKDHREYSHVYCVKHKNNLCLPCYEQHMNCGIRGESCHLCVIGGVKWIDRLVEGLCEVPR